MFSICVVFLLFFVTQEKNKNKIVISDDKQDLVDQLTRVFSNSCNNQICWLRTDLVKQLDQVHK